MIKYTYEDVIINPNDPRLENAIGKECYLSDYPKYALDKANNFPSDTSHLKRIEKYLASPFIDDVCGYDWAVIILKKDESESKYVPFDNMYEFLHRYLNINVSDCKELPEQFKSTNMGMWIKYIDDNEICRVDEISREGLFIGDNRLKTDWEDLFNKYVFLDNSPCGKLKE